MSSEFTPPALRPLGCPNLLWHKIKEKWWFLLLFYVVLPLIPYESKPKEPEKGFPETTTDIPDEQLAQCQEIYKESEAGGVQIERKAQGTFTVIAFLMPALSAIPIFLLQDPKCEIETFPLKLLLISTFLLVLSIISALRGMTVHNREFLSIHAVIDKETGKFDKYKKTHYAKGLLYCAMMNTAIDNHRAELVRSAHILLIISIIFFVSGMTALVF